LLFVKINDIFKVEIGDYMHKERDVDIQLEDYNEQKHIEVVKEGRFDLYENEFELVKDELGLPVSFMELGMLEQKMILMFIDNDYIEPYSHKHTKNNAFISFLASWDNDNVKGKIFIADEIVKGVDKEGNSIVEQVIIPNPKEHGTYLKLKAQASALWKKYNLKEVSKAMREIVSNDGFKDEELLQRKIIDDALSNERDSFTMQNRRVATEITGMKKPSGMIHINVWEKSGGKEATRTVIEATGQDSYQLIPEDIE
jgi:hypothetical protein